MDICQDYKNKIITSLTQIFFDFFLLYVFWWWYRTGVVHNEICNIHKAYVILFCRSGARAVPAKKVLLDMGYLNVSYRNMFIFDIYCKYGL
jgi:hypothetical protein